MNYFMVKRLILKDWYFQRGPIAAYTAGGLLALAFIALGSEASFYAGTVLLLTVMITMGIHLAMVTVVQERSDHTLPFIMTLPISPKEYTTAKILANLSLYLIPWATLTIAALLLFSSEGARDGALIPFTSIVLTQLLASYCLLLTVAIVSESQGWTITAMAIANLFLQGFLYWLNHQPNIARGMKGHGAVWDQMSVTLIVVELLVSVLLLSLAFVLQSRKRDFV
ncbi:MAG TPA: ABC-2 transporter permease [Thermoanaerobaculia bacterium]|jgi:ABC-type Na+ efflux pump permease subunit|nr:ABC-2 transporter permease [Thermoanaerobaculia bacterium]